MEEASTLLPDGRTLVWAEFGEPTGAPLFLFHGWPGSRLVGSHFDEAARDLGVRIICPDRPGVGRSTHLPRRLITDWPNDIGALAARLEVERFVAAGKSAGAPYVLACAAALRSRVSACGLLSPSGEINTRDSLVGVKQPNRLLFAWSRRSSLGRRFFVAVTGAALRSQRSPLVKGLPQELATRVRSEAMEGYRGGRESQLRELELLVRPWGFDLTQVESPVLLWQVRKDANLADDAGRRIAEALPDCRPVYPDADDADHFWTERHAKEVLSRLLDARR
jgi:pimeloyl-ACP methyl ester carboxylesterase